LNDLGAVERQVGDVDPDGDLDGVPDAIDNCPADANGDQLDIDGDGIGNVCDASVGILLKTLALPDMNGDGHGEVGLLSGDTGLLVIQDGNAGTLLRSMPFFVDGGYTLVDAAVLADADGDANGAAEIAVLGKRDSDNRPVVEIRNVAGPKQGRRIFFARNVVPMQLKVIDELMPRLAVLSVRNKDGSGLVEVKNAFGPEDAQAIVQGGGLTPIDLEIVPDADGNTVPEVAVLSSRVSDGLVVVELRNAYGDANRKNVRFGTGITALDMTVVGDKDNNGVPDIAVLSQRDSDGRYQVESRNGAGGAGARALLLPAGQTPMSIEALADADNNGVPEFAVLATRDSDGAIQVEIKNAAGTPNSNRISYSSGFTPLSLSILTDVDNDGTQEAGVLMFRGSDGRILLQGRNGAGASPPVNFWFSD
jgi:hypothetical protein